MCEVFDSYLFIFCLHSYSACNKIFLSQINLGIYVEDGNKELSVLVDRAVGGSSITEGQIELMLHR